MKAVAGFFSQNSDCWEEIGILHDIDFEYVNGDMQQHDITGSGQLKDAGVSDDICRIVEPHNHFLHAGTYGKPVEIAPQAADSASGLIIACSPVKSGRFSEFAAGCVRNRIALLAPLIKIPHFYYALSGMMEIKSDLGLG